MAACHGRDSLLVAPARCSVCPNRDTSTKEAIVRSWTDRVLAEATPVSKHPKLI